ncbi:MAG: lipopolysaccharide biosynthesis protein RfbH [Thaumarchaeota archaeon]|jgi:CDP-6-deoxy-D-xylo-4-hexulose-3-dehydrase|nr:MAG: lipopolysaccharide biosynthesis protein RfbH [Nitrososphaerota archaeon]
MDLTNNILKNSKIDNDESSNLRKNILELVIEYSKISHKKKDFVPGKTMIPVSGKVFDETELQFLVSSSLDFWLTSDRFNREFEKKISEFLNSTFVLTTNSGSSANLLAISALKSKELGKRSLNDGDEVITVAAGFPTTVNPIIQNNLIPVFVDVKLGSYVIDETRIENAISDKTKAIMLAHTLGNPFNLKYIKELCKKYNLWLIEDCCDALGSTYDDKHVGYFGDIGTLSFFPAHHITMGEGGAVFTDNPLLKKIMESIRDWGRDCFCAPGKNNTCGKRFEWKMGELPEGYDHKYTYSHLGYNLKITDMQAAVGLGQLTKLSEFIQTRQENFSYLKNELEQFKKYLILPESTPKSKPSWFGFPITVKESAPFSKNDLVNFLSSKLIDTRPLFAGNITKQPYFTNTSYRVVGNLKNTDLIMCNTFWIGVFPGLTKEMLEYILSQFNVFIKKYI